GPRNGITKDNMGEIYNCYFNRIRNYSSSSNYYLELDDMPTSDNSGIIQDAIPFAEEDRGHWKLTEAITFDLESGTVSTDDLLDALNLKVQLLDEENLLNWCDSGMGFNNLQLPVFCDFDVTEISENRTNNDQVLLYPNPANGLVRISGMEVAEVQIYNTLGQLLKTCRNTNEISVSDAPAGLYLLRITDENGATATGKVVVK
uniref:T9SS type A sorting domain-containing protein n=1 Tax=Jeotgalibaca porci TaxID=1868793 RepID=UPI0035A0BDD4